MQVKVRRRTTCRLCDSLQLECVVALLPIPLSERYEISAERAKETPRFPVDVYMCRDCSHVQQLDVIDPDVLWDGYSYFSGEAKGMLKHFEQFAMRVIDKAAMPDNALVVDIGSNDGSLLQFFKNKNYRVIGIDPAACAVKRANDNGIPTYCSLLTEDLAEKIRQEHGPAAVVCAFNVFAHADDLSGMVKAARAMLADDGLFYFEAQYLMDIVDGVLIATIFHEHISHHSLKPLVQFFETHGLELIDVDRSRNQHGSIIGTVQLKGGARMVGQSVRDLLKAEEEKALDKIETLKAFARRVSDLRSHTAALAEGWKGQGKTVAGFGAARSGPTLIAQLGLENKIDFIVDDNPNKIGRYSPGDGIPIMPTAALDTERPDYVVILAWVHAQYIVEHNRDYLENGGHFVVLCPETRVIGKNGEISEQPARIRAVSGGAL